MASGKNRRRKHKRQPVSASQLAQMGVCERLVVFEHRYGKLNTVGKRQAIERGLRAHERFYRDGPADLVQQEYRKDRAMRPWQLGRWLSWPQYFMASARRELPGRSPATSVIVRFVLRLVVWCGARLIQTREPRVGN
jgi:hypothetical protein